MSQKAVRITAFVAIGALVVGSLAGAIAAML